MVEWLSRSRASVLGVISWSAMGEAVTMVPSVAIGGGWGLLGRNKGWMRSSMEGSNFWNLGGGLVVLWADVGREKFGGLEGGEDFGCRGDELLHPTAVAVSDVVA